MSDANERLIEAIAARGQRMTLGGCGVRLASDYVKGILAAAGTDGMVLFPDAPGLLKDAETRLVYRNDEMVYERPKTSIGDIKQYCDSIGVEVPPRTMMVNELIVTSTKEDRDGDRLYSKGAMVDPKMPGLWHHMLPAVVGRMLGMRLQDDRHVRIASAVMESPLGNDVANLIEFGALRISHGFRPLEFQPRGKGAYDRGPKGFDIKSFEVLEFSYVSVPSNTEAEIIAWSRGKVHTPVVKAWCRALYDQRDKIFPSGVIKGGPGSGNFGHEGRPGEISGSGGGEGGAANTGPKERLRDRIEGTAAEVVWEANRNVNRARAALKKAKDKLAAATANPVPALREKLEVARSLHSEAKEKVENLTAKLEASHARIAALKQRLAELKKQKSSESIADVERELAAEEAKVQAVISELDAVVNELESAIADLDKKGVSFGTVEVPLTLKLDIRPTFFPDNPEAAMHVIQPGGQQDVDRPVVLAEEKPANNGELTDDEVRNFIRQLNPGDLVAVEEKPESNDSQVAPGGWSGKVTERADDYSYAIVQRPDGGTNQITTGRRYRALTRQPEADKSVKAMRGEEALTDEDRELGENAKRQAEEGDNPPSWAVDEDLWERAKQAASKTYDEGDEAYWAVVVHIYQNMGGTIQGKKAPAKPEEKAMATKQAPGEKGKCPECGEMVHPEDGKCPECGAEMEAEKAAKLRAKAAVSAGQDLIIESIDGAASAIQVAVEQLNAAAGKVGDVRAHFVSGGKSSPARTKQEDGEEDKEEPIKCPECGEMVMPDADGKCPKCGASMAKPVTKAGRVLSAANENLLRQAFNALQSILNVVAPPPDKPYRPVPEPTNPNGDYATDPKDKLDLGPTRVAVNNADGSVPVSAACQAILVKMLGETTERERRMIRNLADTIQEDVKLQERAKRQKTMRKLLKVRS